MVLYVYFVLLSWCWNQPRVRLKPWRCLTIMLVFFPPAREVVSACIACAASLCSPWIFFPPFLIFLFRFVLAVAHRGTYLGPVYLFICAFFLIFCSRLETNSTVGGSDFARTCSSENCRYVAVLAHSTAVLASSTLPPPLVLLPFPPPPLLSSHASRRAGVFISACWSQ